MKTENTQKVIEQAGRMLQKYWKKESKTTSEIDALLEGEAKEVIDYLIDNGINEIPSEFPCAYMIFGRVLRRRLYAETAK